ncbi:MAG: mevalonate kinase [Phototrophicales bacterium]|nr:MAG: mevalonate kinase [Phototrophicales bacterium]RMG76181.1 MAG: mevalonate kinase [Chloroflexota bacterium]
MNAPAKIILFGEHAVVYGQPAIAVPVSSLRAEATIRPAPVGTGLHIEAADLNEVLPVDLESDLVDNALILTARTVLKALNAPPPDAIITVTSHIPMASGLGSGAAVSTAVARAVAKAVHVDITLEQTNQIVYEIEKIYHGTPSGIDNTVIVYEQPVYFIREQPIEKLTIGAPMTLVIADTGEASLTRIAVGDVRKLYEAEPERIQPIIMEIGDIARRAKTAILNGNISSLGPLMLKNHALLQKLTVSAPSLDHLVDTAMEAGAQGAKLSGGGRGGNMIALCAPHRAEHIKEALLRSGAVRAFITKVT